MKLFETIKKYIEIAVTIGGLFVAFHEGLKAIRDNLPKSDESK